MKQAIVFVLASAALAGAVTAAHVLVPLPEGTSFRTVSVANASANAEGAPAQVASPAALPRAAVESRQPPVPLLTRERAAWVGPSVNEARVPGPASGVAATEEGSRFAKGAIEADGYKGVRDIIPGPDGTWRARALRGRTEVLLSVDREGRVSAD
jgi:hypothetical protein